MFLGIDVTMKKTHTPMTDFISLFSFTEFLLPAKDTLDFAFRWKNTRRRTVSDITNTYKIILKRVIANWCFSFTFHAKVDLSTHWAYHWT